MSDFRKHLEEELKDPNFKEEWDKLELRYAVIKQLIKIRNNYNLSQAQLAKKLNTTQAVISRIEIGFIL
jgi:ribosome-binding protein aMBF1 (putative translation factor)